jgi:hypothetical protein
MSLRLIAIGVLVTTAACAHKPAPQVAPTAQQRTARFDCGRLFSDTSLTRARLDSLSATCELSPSMFWFWTKKPWPARAART